MRAPHVEALAAAMGCSLDLLPRRVRERSQSDVELEAFAEAHGIPTEFSSWIPAPPW